MGRQPFRATFAERTGSTLANGSVEAGARRVAGGAGFVRERLARPARAGTPMSDDPPTGSPARGADAAGRLGDDAETFLGGLTEESVHPAEQQERRPRFHQQPA